MQVCNRTIRYHLVIQATPKMAARNPAVAARSEDLIRAYESRLGEHRAYIRKKGIDPAEITNWEWGSS
ncbi:MAG: hypothetical protein LAO31_01775 [Acidobacteriia bacterium]|nr:hypothetical protein [Terriglobia bacterium]